MTSIHTIPVPHGWTPEQAWEHIARGGIHISGLSAKRPCSWANVRITNGHYQGIADDRVDKPDTKQVP